MKIKNVKNFKNCLDLYLPKVVVAGRRDSTLFGVVDDTKTTKFCWPRLRGALHLSHFDLCRL